MKTLVNYMLIFKHTANNLMQSKFRSYMYDLHKQRRLSMRQLAVITLTLFYGGVMRRNWGVSQPEESCSVVLKQSWLYSTFNASYNQLCFENKNGFKKKSFLLSLTSKTNMHVTKIKIFRYTDGNGNIIAIVDKGRQKPENQQGTGSN